MWMEVAELGELVRSGKATWEDLDLDDIDTRLKWAGLFHRRKRVPGTFMMRLKVSTQATFMMCGSRGSSPWCRGFMSPFNALQEEDGCAHLRCCKRTDAQATQLELPVRAALPPSRRSFRHATAVPSSV